MTIYMSTVDTPAGPFTVVVDDDGAVLAAGWTAQVGDLVGLIHPTLVSADGEAPQPRRDVGSTTQAVRDYHRGVLDAPASIEVRQHSDGPFLRKAWQNLRDIPAGETISYTGLAERTGNPRAVRAAAQACARNAVALFVPCHRVVRTDASLGGFRWGLSVKRWLLEHEGT